MPYTQKQHNLFEMCAHNPSKANRKCPPKAVARKLASEGVKGRKFPKRDKKGYL